jgi:hypothetical protein
MDQILMPLLEVCHAGLDFTLPAGSHPDVSALNLQLHAASKLFIWSVWFVLFVWLNETNQMNQINQTNQINQLLLVDISKLYAALKQRLGVRV